MFNQLNRQQQRTLAIGILLVVLLLFIQMIVVPAFSVTHSLSEEVNDLRFKLTKYQQAVNNKPLLAQQLTELKETIQQSEIFQSKQAPGIVAATLQKNIRQLIESVGGDIVSTQVLPEKKEHDLTRVAVSVRLTASDNILNEFLLALESNKPLLLVDKLAIATNRRPKGVGLTQQPINISMEVATYISNKVMQ